MGSPVGPVTRTFSVVNRPAQAAATLPSPPSASASRLTRARRGFEQSVFQCAGDVVGTEGALELIGGDQHGNHQGVTSAV